MPSVVVALRLADERRKRGPEPGMRAPRRRHAPGARCCAFDRRGERDALAIGRCEAEVEVTAIDLVLVGEVFGAEDDVSGEADDVTALRAATGS